MVAMTAKTFTARCTRAGGWWAISVPAADGLWTQAKRLDQIEAMAREAIGAVLDLDDDQIEVRVEVDLDDPALDETVENVRHLRAEAERLRHEASQQMAEAVHLLRDKADLPMRDVAKLLGVSHQRVGQIARR
jgi:predicted RNase H-like HicB family nuclease